MISPRRMIVAAGLLLCFASPAVADLKICNSTTGRVGVALGYQGAKGWVTEGWWTIAGETCETLLLGKPKSRVFYVHAIDYDRGGEWAGPAFMCTDDKAFVIRGSADCEERGHKRAGFMEVDTNNAHDWTIRLGDPPEAPTK
ncbi:MAG: DUF1036 domain-containing protein [Hyphomicrobiaceae bacterium]